MHKIAWVVVVAIILLGLFYFIPNFYKVLPGSAWMGTAVPSEHFSTWKEFVPRSGLFKVMLPNQPQYAKDFVAIPDSDKKRRYDMYASEKIDGTLFLISVITYPQEVNISSDILKQTVDELMRNKPDNKLNKVQDNPFKIHPALDFNFDNRDFHVEGKVLMVDKTVYVLSYITRINEFDPAEFEYFIDSFDLLDKETKNKEIPSEP